MAKLVLTGFVTLDGVHQAPGGPHEDFRGGFGQGGWSVPYGDEDFGWSGRVPPRSTAAAG